MPELDVALVATACRQRVEALSPELLPLAERLLERLPPRQWTLEWQLPWWLGHAFRLDPWISQEIVLGNVLGLASIRLQDDLIDGEVEAGEIGSAQALSAMLYREAVSVYRRHLGTSSSFWAQFEAYISQWRVAAQDNAAPRSLAARGAPLKVSALAICTLAGRPDRFPALERCLDHVLTAMVLYDHLVDWEADLDGGRWNAFVAAISSEPQQPPNRERNRTAVLVAMMTTGAIASHFARIDAEIAQATALAESTGPPQFADFLRGYALRTGEQDVMLQAHYRQLAERAVTTMFGAR